MWGECRPSQTPGFPPQNLAYGSQASVFPKPVLVSRPCPWWGSRLHQTSLTKHSSNDKIIKNFKTGTAEWGPFLSLEPCDTPWVAACEAGPAWGRDPAQTGGSATPSGLQGCAVCSQAHVFRSCLLCTWLCPWGSCGSGEQSLGLNPSSTTCKLRELWLMALLLWAALLSSAKWGQKY